MTIGDRVHQVLLLISLLLLSWLGMMTVHELGHVFGALMTGGQIERVVLHPLKFSRTDVRPNPSPHLVAWLGPIIGIVLPAIAAALAHYFRFTKAYLLKFFAGFCLIANGVYLGIGSFEAIGDAGDLLSHGTPQYVLVCFCIITVGAGFWLWHHISPAFGFGKNPKPTQCADTYLALTLLVCLFAAMLIRATIQK